MSTHSERAGNVVKSDRAGFWHNIRLELFVGLGCSLVLGIVYAFGRGVSGLREFLTDINSWILLVTGVIFPAYITSKLLIWRELPVACVTKLFRKIVDRHPELSSFSRWRALTTLSSLSEQLHDLQGAAGLSWDGTQRHNTATELFESRNEIKCYWATSTDPPFESSEAEARFIQRQRDKLKKADVRRLLVVPLGKLINNLGGKDQRKHVKDFLRLHDVHFELRYWPYDAQALATILREGLPGNITQDPLVDFGIIDNEIVFGQKIKNEDQDRPTGNGRIITEPSFVECYNNAFQSLWNQLMHKCNPAQQLEAWVWAMENRSDSIRLGNSSESKDYFETITNQIVDNENLFAVDVALDMNLWWKKEEYVAFRDASIKCARNHNTSGKQIRIYILYVGLENLKAAELFIDEVVSPQLEAGMELVFMNPSALIEHDLAAIDFVSNGVDWGFYLMPTDDFEKNKLSEAHNSILSPHLANFQSIFDALYQCQDTRQIRMSSPNDMHKMPLKQFLCTSP